MRHHRTAVLLSGVIALALVAPAAMASNSHASGHGKPAAATHGQPAAATHGQPAHAGPTKITFKLRPNQIPQGGTLTSTLTFASHTGHVWTPLPDAAFVVTVDGVEVGSGITDVNGQAVLTYVGADIGSHVMKVLYAGDLTHKGAQRAQGFTVDAPVVV